MGVLGWLFGQKPRTRERDDLEHVEREERIRKLRAESAILEFQSSPRGQRRERLKTIAGISAFITGLAAITGIAVSAYQYFHAEKSSREIRVEERLDRALALLGSETPATRLAGVVSLSSFLSAANQRQANQALLALTRAIGLEPSAPVRGAIVSSLADAAISRQQCDMALGSLVQVSRNLVAEEELATGLHPYGTAAPQNNSAEARAISASAAMAALLRRGGRVQDMSGVYLVNEDLHGLVFDSVTFRHAILSNVNFSGATLVGSSFEDANLEGASFRSARLLHANFRQAGPQQASQKRAYIGVQIRDIVKTYLQSKDKDADLKTFSLRGPDFTCADLTSSDFTGHPLYVWANLPQGSTFSLLTSFQQAELRDATFASITIVGLVAATRPSQAEAVEGPPFETSNETMSDAGSGYMVIESTMGAPSDQPSLNLDFSIVDESLDWKDSAIHRNAESNLREAFRGSDWPSARLPQILRATLSPAKKMGAPASPCR